MYETFGPDRNHQPYSPRHL